MNEKQNKLNTIALLGNVLDMNGLEIRTEWHGDYTEIYIVNKRTNTKVSIPMIHTDKFVGIFNGIVSNKILNSKKEQEYYELD